MITVRGKQLADITADELRSLIDAYDGVTLDVGAGDGRFVYHYAQQHPERFVIGIDPVRENMREISAKAAKKRERGGAANVLFVVGSIEQPPEELRGVADEIFVTLPWGSLMRGIILGEAQVLDALASFGTPGARMRIVLNTRIFDDPVPLEARDLPEVTPDYARETLAPAFERAGMRIGRAEWMDADEVATLGTTWAKRLSHRRPPRSVAVYAARTTTDNTQQTTEG
ncbi:MAG: class I SAM-dependent methyltransferase [Dehalococcoidia bacterium]